MTNFKTHLLMIMTMVMILGLSTVMTKPAQADVLPELVQYLEQEIGAADGVVAAPLPQATAPEDCADPKTCGSTRYNWFFRRMFLRLRFMAGFSVPFLASLKVIPETELMWERPYPEGWGSYKPQN